MAATMTPAAADWIYAEVLTPAYRRSVGAEGKGDEEMHLGPAAVRNCRCMWGPCGHCQANRPDRCAHRRGTAPASLHDGYVLGRDGSVRAAWRRTGTVCVWRCPGPPGGDLLFTVTTGAAPERMRPERLVSAKLAPAEQLDLFAVGGAQ